MQAMDFLQQLLGIELNVVARTLIAFAVVLVLIVLVAWLFRRLSRGAGRMGRRGRLTRLAVLEAIQIDPRRRLVLFRRDNTEHLILIGGATDVVVEQGIHRAPRQPGARAPERVEPAVRAPLPGRAPPPRPESAPPPRSEPAPPEPPRPAAAKPEPAPPERRPPGPAAPPPGGPRPAAPPPPPPEPAPKGATERQLADMADRLKAALRTPVEGGEEAAEEPEPAGAAEEEKPGRPGGPRRPE